MSAPIHDPESPKPSLVPAPGAQSPQAQSLQTETQQRSRSVRRPALQGVVLGSIGVALVLFGAVLAVVTSEGSLSAFFMTGWLYVIPLGLLASIFGIIGLVRNAVASRRAKRSVSESVAPVQARGNLLAWGRVLSLVALVALPLTIIWLALAG